jgi:hypothetical protein
MEKIGKIASLANNRNEAISIYASVGTCIINGLIQQLIETGAPPQFIDRLVIDIRASITTNLPPEGTTHRVEE